MNQNLSDLRVSPEREGMVTGQFDTCTTGITEKQKMNIRLSLCSVSLNA